MIFEQYRRESTNMGPASLRGEETTRENHPVQVVFRSSIQSLIHTLLLHEIVNIVASGDMKIENLNLNQVAMALGLENIEYEPEQFPGLVFRMRKPKVVTLIFSTGKVICTGARNKDDVVHAFSNLKKELEDHDFL
jgi:TATA-box binding protein (TBP) (component of TFIID and TFIIIB)